MIYPPHHQDGTFGNEIQTSSSSGLDILASVVMKEHIKSQLGPKRSSTSSYSFHSSIGDNTISPMLKKYLVDTFPCAKNPSLMEPKLSTNASNRLGFTSSTTLPPIFQMISNKGTNLNENMNNNYLSFQRPYLPSPPPPPQPVNLDVDIYIERTIFTNLIYMLNKSDTLATTVGMLKKLLFLRLTNSPTPIKAFDENCYITPLNFRLFQDEIPNICIKRLIKDLNLLAESLHAIKTRREAHNQFSSRATPELILSISEYGFRTPDPSMSSGKTNVSDEESRNDSLGPIKHRRDLPKLITSKSPPSSLFEFKCQHCGLRKTPEWRKGPDGSRTLCNACGLFYAKLQRRFGKSDATRLMKQRKRNGEYNNRVIPSTIT